MKAATISVIIVSLLACALFFMPYFSADEEYQDDFDEVLNVMGDIQLDANYNFTVEDMRDPSLMDYARLFHQYSSKNEDQDATFIAVFFFIFLALAVLCLLFACLRLPVLMIVSALLLGGLNIFFHMGMLDTISSSPYNFSIACYGYYICAALLVILGIWLFVAKHETKKLKQQQEMLNELKEELGTLRQELNGQKEELWSQRQELNGQQEELRSQRQELNGQKGELWSQRQGLNELKDELRTLQFAPKEHEDAPNKGLNMRQPGEPFELNENKEKL